MKRKMAFAACAAALLLEAGAAKPAAAPAMELASLVELAPFAELTAKVRDFGTIIGNPIVPTLLLSMLQQSAVATYGNARSDAPMYILNYTDAAGGTAEAVVYPSVDRIAHKALANPGSERIGKDTLRLSSESDAHGRYVVYSADGMFASFAPTAALARQALVDSAPGTQGSMPLARARLWSGGIRTISEAGRSASVTNNVADMLKAFARLEVSLDLDDQGAVLAFSGRSRGVDRLLKDHLVQKLKESFSGLSGGDAALAPAISVKVADGGAVSGDVRLSREQLKGMGRDFNSFVAAQMSGALADEDDGKNKKKNLKVKESGR